MNNIVTIPKHMDADEFWSSILGSLEFQFEWWLGVRYLDDADWNKAGVVELTIEDEDGKPLRKKLTVDDLLVAYGKAVSEPYFHCGMKVDIDNMDECASDIVLQLAMFDDVVYA